MIWVFFNAVSIPIIFLFYPETANRRLEDIDIVFKDGLRTLVFMDKEAIQPQRPARFIALDEEELANARAAQKSEGGTEIEQIEG